MKTYMIWSGRDTRYLIGLVRVEAETPEQAWEIGMKDHWLKSRPDLCSISEVIPEKKFGTEK